jgi:hypothetical protein
VSTNSPLNVYLHKRLVRDFGHVRVSNEGEEMIASYRLDPLSGDKRLIVQYPGEYYQVCCPRCTDTRYRLYINHRWGIRDEAGRINLWLAICYNENCFSAHAARSELYDDLQEATGALRKAKVREGIKVDLDAIVVVPPGPVTRLDHLPATHPANTYLANRFYDPEQLGRVYGVGYCQDSLYYLARHRIYAPIFMKGILRGWQVRHVGDLDWKDKSNPPKWWSCPHMKRGHIMYNLDIAKTYKTGVATEGPGDVWNFGPMSIATFGESMSRTHEKMFVSAFRKHSGVLLYDPEAMVKKKTELLAERLSDAIQGGCAPVKLPSGDPGSLDRNFMREFVRKEALGMGVKVSWRRRSA